MTGQNFSAHARILKVACTHADLADVEADGIQKCKVQMRPQTWQAALDRHDRAHFI
jgi:hypothetical protein